MQLSFLDTFLMIVETGNLRRAADRLNVTQSTVTTRLNTLERELGQALFLRRKSGAELTSAGFKFLRYAELMVELWRQARQETALPPEIEGVCNLACHFDLWHGLGERFFELVRRNFPQVAISAWPGEQADIDRWLASGLVDAAFCYSPKLSEDRKAISLPDDRLILVSCEKRALMRWDPAYIFVDNGEAFRRAHAATYPDGDMPQVTFGGAVWALEHMIRHGGSAYLPQRLIESHLQTSKLHQVVDAPEFFRPVNFVYVKSASDNWHWLDSVLKSLSSEGS